MIGLHSSRLSTPNRFVSSIVPGWLSLALFLVLLFFSSSVKIAKAQADSNAHWHFSGYGELYYSYDFSNPDNHEKASYIYNHKRHNEINLNLAFVKAAYAGRKVRANLAVMAGNYAEYNLASEPTWAQFMMEANIGLKLSKKSATWLDVGILPSHIGFESAISADCATLTRSLLAENSPYYETGIRLNHSNKKGTLQMNLLLLNGWQHIRRPNGMQSPSLGMQINVQASPFLQLNYSNFIGSDKPDSLKSKRIYHDLYAIWKPHDKVTLTAGLDIGTEFTPQQDAMWFSPVLIVQYTIDARTRMALRGEHFRDNDEVIIQQPGNNGFRLSGVSLNLDRTFYHILCWRMEAKVFSDNFSLANNNYSLTTNVTIRF